MVVITTAESRHLIPLILIVDAPLKCLHLYSFFKPLTLIGVEWNMTRGALSTAFQVVINSTEKLRAGRPPTAPFKKQAGTRTKCVHTIASPVPWRGQHPATILLWTSGRLKMWLASYMVMWVCLPAS
jgi:hypothetical protein